MVQCEVVEKTSRPVCHASSGLIDCTFYNVTQGNYCVIVRFEDDRCTKGTVWSDEFHDPCRWDIRKGEAIIPLTRFGIFSHAFVLTEFNVEDFGSDTKVDNSSTGILYTAIALAVLLGIIAVACILRKRSLRRQNPPTDAARKTKIQICPKFFECSSSNSFLFLFKSGPRPSITILTMVMPTGSILDSC